MAQFIDHAMTKREVLEGVDVDVVRSRMVAKHTAMYWEHDGTEHLRYIQTDVVIRHPDHSYSLFSGGYRGPTTKKRINEYLPHGWGIWQADGVWYIGKHTYHYGNPGQSYVFVEGLKLVPDDEAEYKVEYPEGAGPAMEQERVKELTKKINKYANRFKALGTKNSIPYPDIGDCLICQVEAQQDDPFKPGEGTDHLESHLDEGYIHGSIWLNALRWAGYPNPGFVWNHWNAAGIMRRYLKFRFGISTG